MDDISSLLNILKELGASELDSAVTRAKQRYADSEKKIHDALSCLRDEVDENVNGLARKQSSDKMQCDEQLVGISHSISSLKSSVAGNTSELQYLQFLLSDLEEKVALLSAQKSGKKFWKRLRIPKIKLRINREDLYLFLVGCLVSGSVAAGLFWFLSNGI